MKRQDNPSIQKVKGEIHPWYRYFARGLDASLYATLWMVIKTYVLRWYPLGGSISFKAAFEGIFLGIVVGWIFLFLLEPLCLSRFGTTPGKWIFGIRVRKKNGERLTFKEALKRTWTVFSKGMLFEIPLLGWVRMWDHKQFYEQNGYVAWDQDYTYSFSGKSTAVVVALYIIVIVVSSGVDGMMEKQAMMPKQRGEITIAEFAENYNGFKHYYYNNYFTWSPSEAGLNEKGEWVEVHHLYASYFDVTDQAISYLDEKKTEVPVMKYETDADGVLTKVTMSWSISGGTKVDATDYFPIERIVTVAFVGAQKEVSALNGGALGIMSEIWYDEDIDIQIGGVDINRVLRTEGGKTSCTLTLEKVK